MTCININADTFKNIRKEYPAVGIFDWLKIVEHCYRTYFFFQVISSDKQIVRAMALCGRKILLWISGYNLSYLRNKY